MAKTKKKGRNTDFGFYWNRPFYIMSKLPMRRVIEVVGARNLVIKNIHRNRSTQKWVFDQTSKTIKSWAYRGRSINIYNNGRNSNLEIISTNSRWW